jgi:hypothetical protein
MDFIFDPSPIMQSILYANTTNPLRIKQSRGNCMLGDGNSYRETGRPVRGNTAYTPAPIITIANPGQVVAGR